MKAITGVVAAVAMVFLADGCTFPLVGSFPQHNEVFDGTVCHNPFSTSSDIRVHMRVGDVNARGFADVKHIPTNSLTGSEIKGQHGIFEIAAEDGRLVKGTWVADSLTSGYGWGEDQYGNPVRFSFGMKAEEASAKIEAELAKAAKRPPLPQAKGPATQPSLFREVPRAM